MLFNWRKEKVKEHKIYDVIDIAVFVINYAIREQNRGISNLKLQKILYFLQAESMVSRGVPLFKEELVALPWGPYQKDVYHEFRMFGSTIIPEVENYWKRFEGESWFNEWNKVNYSDRFLDLEDREMIINILDEVKDFSSNDLLKIIMNQSPWIDAYYNNKSKTITPEMLYDFFYDENVNGDSDKEKVAVKK